MNQKRRPRHLAAAAEEVEKIGLKGEFHIISTGYRN
jgi:hypothetical protein